MLTVSNIAWHDGADPVFIGMVAAAGFDGIDLAPTKVWPGWQLPSDHGADFRRSLAERGLATVGMQSLFFGAGPLNLFATDPLDWQAFINHMETLAAIANATGATRVVFGSPCNRDPGNLEDQQAWELACNRFRDIGDRYNILGIQLCVEPVPAAIGGKFLQTTTETAEFLKLVGHPAVRLNLDTAVLQQEAADIPRTIAACAGLIGHVHASEPKLGNFEHPLADHEAVSRALRDVGYQGAVAIEMMAIPGLEAQNLARALAYVGAVYA
jgi:D-psicose/D-tagatose/L-ribulose 3-epimerase